MRYNKRFHHVRRLAAGCQSVRHQRCLTECGTYLQGALLKAGLKGNGGQMILLDRDDMMISVFRILSFAALLILSLSCNAYCGVESPVQSSARPFGLEIVDTVQRADSDDASSDFQDNYLPTFTQWGDLDLTSPSFTDLTSSIAIDPSKINLATQYDTRVYFIGDNTGLHNTLGFNTSGGGISSGDPLLIFPDASETSLKFSFFGRSFAFRTTNEPLLSGDFVDLGTMSSGTQLDFFLIADGAKGGTDVFSTRTSINPDGLSHALAFAMPDSPYLFVGFEDLYGDTTGDYRDLLFAVDIGRANIGALTNMPEPSTLFILSSFIALVVYRKYRLDTLEDTNGSS